MKGGIRRTLPLKTPSKARTEYFNLCLLMVVVDGYEPPILRSQSKCATLLCCSLTRGKDNRKTQAKANFTKKVGRVYFSSKL